MRHISNREAGTSYHPKGVPVSDAARGRWASDGTADAAQPVQCVFDLSSGPITTMATRATASRRRLAGLSTGSRRAFSIGTLLTIITLGWSSPFPALALAASNATPATEELAPADLAASAASAAPSRRRSDSRRITLDGRVQLMAKELDLSPTQQAQVARCCSRSASRCLRCGTTRRYRQPFASTAPGHRRPHGRPDPRAAQRCPAREVHQAAGARRIGRCRRCERRIVDDTGQDQVAGRGLGERALMMFWMNRTAIDLTRAVAQRVLVGGAVVAVAAMVVMRPGAARRRPRAGRCDDAGIGTRVGDSGRTAPRFALLDCGTRARAGGQRAAYGCIAAHDEETAPPGRKGGTALSTNAAPREGGCHIAHSGLAIDWGVHMSCSDVLIPRGTRPATAMALIAAMACSVSAQTAQVPQTPQTTNAAKSAVMAPQTAAPTLSAYRSVATRQQKESTKAKNYYVAAWGVDKMKVSYTASGNLVRFSYRFRSRTRQMLGRKEVHAVPDQPAQQRGAAGAGDGQGGHAPPSRHAAGGPGVLDGVLEQGQPGQAG